MKTYLPFGEWLPDRPELSAGCLTATNVIPRAESYTPLRDLSAYTDALSARARGAAAFKQTDGSVFNFAGDETKLYSLSSSVWDDVSRTTGGAYATTSEDGWKFLSFGDTVIASNATDAVQKYEMGTDTDFSAAAGTPPKFRVGAIVREFAFVGNIGTANFNRIQWCDQNDVTDWTNGQAGSLDIPNGGEVQGITGGEYGLVFQERQIARINYIGPPEVWQLDVIEENRGALVKGSVAKHGYMNFFLSEDGFYMCDGTKAVPIGAEKVDKTILADLDENYKFRCSSAIDPINKLYLFSYPGSGNSSGNPNKIAIYNYEIGRWSIASRAHTIIYTSMADFLDLDAIGAVFSSLDALPFSLDSRSWQGGSLVLSAFGTDHKAAQFNGSTLEAVLETAEVNLNQGGRTLITNTRPVVDATPTVKIGSRARQADTVSYGSASSMNSAGENPVMNENRYQRLEMTIPAAGSWTHAKGIEVVHENAGDY